MYVELRSPNIHEPANLNEYNNTILNYRDTKPFLWAGGTEIMSEPGFYPGLRANVEIISLAKIEELHHFLRNDRFAEFGSMVTIDEIAQAGKLVLPRILLETINATASRTLRERITVGGSLCTQRMRTALASTLMILDASAELRYQKKRMHSKWFQLQRIYDKNGQLDLPEGALLTKVRIAIQQYDYQYFRIAGDPMREKEDAAALAMVARLEQGNISYARVIITLPDKGFIYSRDMDNLVSSLQLPAGDGRHSQIEGYMLDQAREGAGGLSPLREARIRGLLHELLMDLNDTVMSQSYDRGRQV